MPSRTEFDRFFELGGVTAGELLAGRGASVPPSGLAGLRSLSELAARRRLQRFAAQVNPARKQISFLGAGMAEGYLPAVIEAIPRTGVEDSTSVAELQSLESVQRLRHHFAAQIAALTGMASAIPGTLSFTSIASALIRQIAKARPGRHVICIAGTILPATLETWSALFREQEFSCRILASQGGILSAGALLSEVNSEVAAVIVASPNGLGCLEPMSEIGQIAHQAGALFVPIIDPLSLGLLRSPGDYGADFCCGSLYGLGLSDRTSIDAWFLARMEPSEKAGDFRDENGEIESSHLRRVVAFIDAMGASGLHHVAKVRFQNAHFVQAAISQIIGFRPAFVAPFFNEFVINAPLSAAEIVGELEEQGIFAGVPLVPPFGETNHLLMAVTERLTLAEIEYTLKALKQLRNRNTGKILGVDL